MWHRKQDRAGVAYVTSGISKDHQNYLADGGFGFLLGDGPGIGANGAYLSYGRESAPGNLLHSQHLLRHLRGSRSAAHRQPWGTIAPAAPCWYPRSGYIWSSRQLPAKPLEMQVCPS